MTNKHIPKPPKSHPWKRRKAVQGPNRTAEDSLSCAEKVFEESKKKMKKESYHTRCNDCGRFVRKEKWVPKDHPHYRHALCYDCLSGYDCPHSV